MAQATRGAGGVGLPAKVHIVAGNGIDSPAGGANASGYGNAEILSPELSVGDGQLSHHSLRWAPTQASLGNRVTIKLQLASQKDPRVEEALQYHHRNRMRTALLLSRATNNDPTETVTSGLLYSHEQIPYRAAVGDGTDAGTTLGTTHEEAAM